MASIMERFGLDGKTALVTGGAQGIGESFAHALGEAGAKVAVVDLNLKLAKEVVSNLEQKGISAMAIKADVTNPDEVRKMVENVVDVWGELTIAINNAGMGQWENAVQMEYSDWQKIMKLNLDAVFLCAREEAKAMIPNNYGKIINVASMSAHISNTPQNQSAYNTSKAGVLHLTRSLAAEWAPVGIRVNSISPGYTKTALVDNLLETPAGKTMLPQWLSKIPLGRMANTEDLQGAVVFLAAQVSDYMTGSDVLIDGGYCCW